MKRTENIGIEIGDRNVNDMAVFFVEVSRCSCSFLMA